MQSKYSRTSFKTGFVPCGPIYDLVQEWVRSQDDEEATGGLGAISLLCIRAKVNPRRMSEIYSGSKEWCDFDIADRIVCALGKSEYWIGGHDALTEAYEQVNLEVRSRSKEWHPTYAESRCRTCKREFTYIKEFQDGIMCSTRCAAIKGGHRRHAMELIAA